MGRLWKYYQWLRNRFKTISRNMCEIYALE